MKADKGKDCEIRKNDRSLLVGITGTIASGKTTVAKMLALHGAYTIDFDLLAREVVTPGKQAYHDIVNYFGKQILQPNQTLDRQKLSNIVFSDPEKRKKLESFTHPQINLLYLEKLEQISQTDSDAIIQVVVPLLIEQNLQNLFHTIVVVYVPHETLTERLMKRNNIDQEAALRLIGSQISIEKKKAVADFVVDNSKSLARTQKQVDELWRKLEKYRR